MAKILGTTKLSKQRQITLPENAMKRLNAKLGDELIFLEGDDGLVYICTEVEPAIPKKGKSS